MADNSTSEPQTTSLKFHVPPDARPERTIALLNVLRDNAGGQLKREDLYARANEVYGIGKRPNDGHAIAQKVGLLTLHATGKNNYFVSITPAGKRIADAYTERQGELIHYLLYTGWEECQIGLLWSYRRVCNILWERGQTEVSVTRLAGELDDDIETAFSNDPRFSKNGLSVSRKTIDGVAVWLEHLQPPAIQRSGSKRVFARRTTCSRELLLLGIGWVYRDAVGEPDANGMLNSADLLLTRERREALCKLCLLEPAALERMLNAVISTYPRYIGEGTTAGSLGRFIRLYRMPRLEDSDLLI